MKRYDFNTGWTFKDSTGSTLPVTLPHDAMILQARRPDASGGSALAFFPGGRYCYTKEFTLPDFWSGLPVRLQFEGVYKNAQVYVNGKKLGGAAYGYIPFWIDCGVLPDGENVIEVLCENADQPDSRWYSGAGIYRHVWAWVGTGIQEEQIQITTLSINPARIFVRLDTDENPLVEILDGNQKVASGNGNQLEFEIPHARLWDDDNPYLYTCRVADVSVNFGIRQITWNSHGLFVNGKETLLRGGCIHHDNGILGSAAHTESEFRRVRILKQAGYNALRSAHNPCSRALLDACDYYGMYLIDEGWDMWFHHKSQFDYASQWREHYFSDLEAMVRRDFNHPSVILYSIGNEVSEPAKETGVAVTKEMVNFLHTLDSTRPVTGGFNLMIISNAQKGKGVYDEENGGMQQDNSSGFGSMNSTMFNFITSKVGSGMNKAANSKKADAATTPSLDALDISGYNYASGRYRMDGRLHPKRLIYGSETFPQDIVKNWRMVKELPYLVGDFMWTAWDYLGEAGIGAWAYTPDGKGFSKPYPWLLADVGAIDILGNPNGELMLAQAAWGLDDQPMLAVQPVNHPGVTPAKGTWRGTNAIPSWSWNECNGNAAVVEVYSSAATVELTLNDKHLGKKKFKNCKAVFRTKYAPGTLTAVVYDAAGSPAGKAQLCSASGAIVISLAPEKRELNVGNLVYVPVSLTGENGVVDSNSDRRLNVTVSGGELLAFGSANPRTEEQYHTGSFTTYYGRALAIVRASQPGQIKITVSGDGLASAETVISVTK